MVLSPCVSVSCTSTHGGIGGAILNASISSGDVPVSAAHKVRAAIRNHGAPYNYIFRAPWALPTAQLKDHTGIRAKNSNPPHKLKNPCLSDTSH